MAFQTKQALLTRILDSYIVTVNGCNQFEAVNSVTLKHNLSETHYIQIIEVHWELWWETHICDPGSIRGQTFDVWSLCFI
jgi:hypothetical protein